MDKRSGFFQDKKWLAIVIAVLLVGIAAALVWMVVIGRNVYFKNLKSYSNQDVGVSFLVPDGWTPHSHAAGDLEFHPNNLGDHTTPVRLTLTRYNQITSNWTDLDEQAQKNIVDSLLEDVGSGQSTYDFKAGEAKTINGVYGIYGDTVEANSHYSSEMKGIAFVSINPDGFVYKIVVMSEPGIFKANRTGMQDVIDSFEYTE